MRTILIDPLARTIQNLTLPDAHTLDDLYTALGCNSVDCIHLDPEVDLWMDDEGLMVLPTGPDGNVTQGFFVLHDRTGRPHNLVAGKALLTGSCNQETVGLPTWLTPDQIEHIIKWVPDDRRNEAARIAGAIVGQNTVIRDQADLDKIRIHYAVLMRSALALTTPSSTPKPSNT
jgi:hypothetical protein